MQSSRSTHFFDAQQHPDPETGKPKTWTGVAIDAALAVVSVGVGKAASRYVTGSLRSNLAAPTMQRLPAAAVARGADNRRIIEVAAAGVGRAVNPATGRQVSGAAVSTLVKRANAELADEAAKLHQFGEAFDSATRQHGNDLHSIMVGGVRADLGASSAFEIEAAIVQLEPARMPTTDEWSMDELLELVPALTPQSAAARQIERSTTQIVEFHQVGPTSRPAYPVYQLAGC